MATINGKTITKITIDGNVMTAGSKGGVIATIAEIEKHIKDNTVWTSGTGVIDTTAQLEGLDVSYSKSTGLVDMDKVDATVRYLGGDTSIVSPVVTVDFNGIELINPNKTITEQNVQDYLNVNIVWDSTGSTGILDLTKWPYTGTKLSVVSTTIVKGTDVVYTVLALPGFTVNGGATVDYTINIPDTVNVVYTGGYFTQIKKNVNGTFTPITSTEHGNSYMTQVSDGTIYVGSTDGLKKLENDTLTSITNGDIHDGFIEQMSDGTIYVGIKDGIFKLENDKLISYISINVDSGFMMEAKDGTIYVGTNSDGLKKLVNDSLVDVDDTDVRDGFIVESNSGDIYIGSNGGGLYKLENDSLVKIDDNNISGGFGMCTLDGTVYVGGWHGISTVKDKTLTKINSTNVQYGFINQISDGTIYMGYHLGLKKLVNGNLVYADSGNYSRGFLEEVLV